MAEVQERWRFKPLRSGPPARLSVQTADFADASSNFTEWAERERDTRASGDSIFVRRSLRIGSVTVYQADVQGIVQCVAKRSRPRRGVRLSLLCATVCRTHAAVSWLWARLLRTVPWAMDAVLHMHQG